MFVCQTLERLPHATNMLQNVLPMYDDATDVAAIKKDTRQALLEEHGENITRRTIAEESFRIEFHRWQEAVSVRVAKEYTGKTALYGALHEELVRFSLDLEHVFFEVYDIPLGEAIEALDRDISVRYPGISSKISTMAGRSVFGTTPAAFHDSTKSQLMDAMRNALANFHIRAQLDTLIRMEMLIPVDERDGTIENEYEILVNLVFEHMQPRFVQSVNKLYSVSRLFMAVAIYQCGANATSG